MKRLLLRLANALVNLPTRVRSSVRCARLRHFCIADAAATIAPEARIFNPIGKDAISIGKQTLMMGELLVIPSEGKIAIGEWCYVGPGAKIWSMKSIRIGDRVFISHGVQIFDNNSHSLLASERHERYKELRTVGRHLQPENVANHAVNIEDDVWIGFNAAVLKGVTIGRGAVVGACTVVLHDVPPYAVVVGNPARQVGESRP